MFAEKSWGSYRVLDVSDKSMTVKVTLNPGHGMNYHSHDRRDEVWTVISGSGRVVIDGEEGTLKRYHKSNGAVVLEASSPKYPPRVFVGSDANEVRVVGRVIEVRRKV